MIRIPGTLIMIAGLLFGGPTALHAQATPPVLTAYYHLKDALAAGSATKAKASGAELVEALKKADTTKLSAADQKAITAVTTDATHISETTELKHQREHFITLSKNMVKLARATKGVKAFVDFCPMADGNAGAYWLSETKAITANPYFGRAMKCEIVKDTLQ